MPVHHIKRGLDLPITGQPRQVIEDAAPAARVALVADDYPLMKARMHVAEGDEVRRGQLLFDDRKAAGVRFTAPAAGRVVAVNRGARRKLLTVVIEVADADRAGAGPQVEFAHGAGLDRQGIRDLLAESGLWSAIRARPFSRVPSPTEDCHAIFVTAIDTHPLAADPQKVLEGRDADFKAGLDALKKLTDGPVYLCKAEGARIPTSEGVKVEEFAGKHPAGLVGTHIHVLDPVNRSKIVWHVGYQDVAAIGRLVTTGVLDTRRVIAIGGPATKNPRLVRTRLGAAIDPLLRGELHDGIEARVISGSIFGGRQAQGEVEGFLGRYHTQLSVLREGRERVFFGWLRPGFDKYSVIRAFASRWFGGGENKARYEFTTTTNGSPRAMVPIGMYEKVMPLDMMPTFLLRALVKDDIERAEALGCLELDEEDLALCSFVSPGKEDFGYALRRNLTEIWKEG
ncbi:MAG: Na(+)-translocating NADH-quinone reductase subunit A [Myxococcales bacterium]|nr:Na(+)-translocating NADH-quinone reductase subunit A [Myxococcales bacterium]